MEDEIKHFTSHAFDEVSRPYLFALGLVPGKAVNIVTALTRAIKFINKDKIVIQFLHDDKNTVETFLRNGRFYLFIITRTGDISKTLEIDIDPDFICYPLQLGHGETKRVLEFKLEAKCTIRK